MNQTPVKVKNALCLCAASVCGRACQEAACLPDRAPSGCVRRRTSRPVQKPGQRTRRACQGLVNPVRRYTLDDREALTRDHPALSAWQKRFCGVRYGGQASPAPRLPEENGPVERRQTRPGYGLWSALPADPGRPPLRAATTGFGTKARAGEQGLGGAVRAADPLCEGFSERRAAMLKSEVRAGQTCATDRRLRRSARRMAVDVCKSKAGQGPLNLPW